MFLSWLQLHNKHRWFHSGSPSVGLPAFLDCVTWPLQVVAREARASVGPFRLVARHRGLSLSASGVRDRSPKPKGKIHCCFFHETLASVADYKQAVRQFTYTISHSIF